MGVRPANWEHSSGGAPDGPGRVAGWAGDPFAGSCLPVPTGQDGSPSLTRLGPSPRARPRLRGAAAVCRSPPSLHTAFSGSPVPGYHIPTSSCPPLPPESFQEASTAEWNARLGSQLLGAPRSPLRFPKADLETGTWVRVVCLGGGWRRLSEAVRRGAREERKVCQRRVKWWVIAEGSWAQTLWRPSESCTEHALELSHSRLRKLACLSAGVGSSSMPPRTTLASLCSAWQRPHPRRRFGRFPSGKGTVFPSPRTAPRSPTNTCWRKEGRKEGSAEWKSSRDQPGEEGEISRQEEGHLPGPVRPESPWRAG